MKINSQENGKDLSKVLSDWALAAGRYFQSEQTGYVHVHYGDKEQKAQTIPFLENTLFILALLRSRLMEQVQEAKELLKKLLAFQHPKHNTEEGCFPVYLHEYPVCKDPGLGIQLLAPFYWILKQFGHVLGHELNHHLEQAACLILEQSLQLHKLKPFPYSLEVRLVAAQWAYGLRTNHVGWQQQGQERLDQLAQFQLQNWSTTKHLSDLLIGLQMVYSSLLQSPWHLLWQQMENTWHAPLATYMGPCIREWQEKEEPQVNLYDLYSGFFAGQFSRRATLLSYHHLQGILIQPSLDTFDFKVNLSREGQLKGQHWQTFCQPTWAYTLLEKNDDQPSVDKTHTPFRLIWGDLHLLHSFVCQGGHIEKINYLQEEGSWTILFDLRDSSSEDTQPKKEIEFFADFQPDLQFKLNGYTSSTFELGQTLDFFFQQHQLSLVLQLVQGEGDFLGHVMRGNRPSQVESKADKRFHAYDWTFFLRRIRRQKNCKVQALLTFKPFQDLSI